MTPPALICLSSSAIALARRLQPALPGATIHALSRGAAMAHVDVGFSALPDHLCALFRAGVPLVGLCAAGILIRALTPALRDKWQEPPVVAVSRDGRTVVPLLGGHRGANALSRTLAALLGGVAAITTASDLEDGYALDEPPPGWRLANPARAATISAARLAGRGMRVACVTPLARPSLDWLGHDWQPVAENASADVVITDQIPPAQLAQSAALFLHPPVLALGVGCARGASPEALEALVYGTLAAAQLTAASIALVVSLDLKSDEAAIHRLADKLDCPARFFSAASLEQETARLKTPSRIVFEAVGCHGVAEAAALAAAGPEGALVVAKQKSAEATCAIARSPLPLDPQRIGVARGRLMVLGIGPGLAAWRTGEVAAALAAADVVVGYSPYLDLVADLTSHARLETSILGFETERVEQALELAARGARVALISSGDAGIYGLASLVFERLEQVNRADWHRVEITVAPGVSALQAAAARLGAPLGHDFCAISLSDLLTPWEAIERRIEAAAMGDFVVAFYNPRSARRRFQLDRALQILRAHRPLDTPVALARQLGRGDERILVTSLSAVDVSQVDMLTLVLVGSSATRHLIHDGRDHLYTPRGYHRRNGCQSE